MPERIDFAGMNEAQRQAVLHGEGPLLLLAGPGSGKTFTITNRILYLMEQGAAPEAILVITFMKEAALSMQDRFRKMCGTANDARPLVYPVNFGTFHSVFYHILRESHAFQGNALLNNSEKKNLLFPILKTYEKRQECQEAGRSSWDTLGEEALQILSAISFYKNTMNLETAASKAPDKWQSLFPDICREYAGAVKKAGRLDFDDMLFECRELLRKNSAVRSQWQKRFQHILIDEFQDINPVQYEAVKLLAAKPYNIFAVGDDDQAIYGFRGSEPECLKRFVAEFHAGQLLLDINYRSRTEIVQASLAVIGENRIRFEKRLRAAERRPAAGNFNAPVVLKTFENSGEQHEYMIRELGALCRGPDSCAVLFRTNSYMQAFAARLRAADIPYEMRERAVSIYEHFIVKDIVAYLQVAKGKGTREQMLRIMNRPSRYISREAVGEGGADVRGMIRYYAEAVLPERQKSGMLDELSRFERQLRCIRDFSLSPAIHYIVKAAGYERYLREQSRGKPGKWEEWQELLDWLKADAAKHAGLKEWLDFQEEYGADMESGKKQGIQPKSKEGPGDLKKSVQLLTVHGAKGLEFDRVWIPDCNEGVFPHGRMPDEKSVEEERRIFYVAMTRAKKSLELLSLTGTKERPRLPSRFLNPL